MEESLGYDQIKKSSSIKARRIVGCQLRLSPHKLLSHGLSPHRLPSIFRPPIMFGKLPRKVGLSYPWIKPSLLSCLPKLKK